MLINHHKNQNGKQLLSQNIINEMEKAINNCFIPVIVSPTTFENIKQKAKDATINKSGDIIINEFIIKSSPFLPNNKILFLSDDLELRKLLEEFG